MKILLMFFLFTIAVHSREYHYDKPSVGFTPEDFANRIQQHPTIINGNNGRDYEVRMIPSQKVFETRVETNQFTNVNQQQGVAGGYNQYTQGVVAGPTQYANQQPHAVATNPNQGFYSTVINGHFAQPSNQYSSVNPQQPGLPQNQYAGVTTNSFSGNTAAQLNQYSNINPPQQLNNGFSQEQQQQNRNNNNNNNNALNSNNLLNDLINNHKYVSQSEASQLDVYPYKQLQIGNTRPFTRTITKCDARGQCEPQSVAAGGDFQHQQVLKQSKAQIQNTPNKCRSAANYDYTSSNSLNTQQQEQKSNTARKGTDLRNRRLFPYGEVVIPQYPTN